MTQVGHVTVRLYGELAGLASGAGHDVPVELPRAVKDVIESLGVPHTEVDLVLVNGSSAGFKHRVAAGDRVSVFPAFRTLDVGTVSRVRPGPPPAAGFVLDVHLGGLARWLRLLGLDVSYRNDVRDAELADMAARERRILLTRDRGLLMRGTVVHGYLIRAHDPQAQALEVVERFDLRRILAPFTRCLQCGGALEPVSKDEIADLLEPGTRAHYDDFSRCIDCSHLYWPGSHYARLQRFVDEVRVVTTPRRATP